MTLKDGERSGRFAMLAKNPASVQGLAFMLIFPLTFGSKVFAPTAQLPGWLQAWVKVNPVTQVSDAVRGLLDLPLGRTITTSLLWTAGILVVFVPLAVRAYRRQAWPTESPRTAWLQQPSKRAELINRPWARR